MKNYLLIFVLIKGIYINCCSDVNCFHCHKINGEEICNACRSNYIMVDGKCVFDDLCLNEACLTCERKVHCTSCREGKVLINGFCEDEKSDSSHGLSRLGLAIVIVVPIILFISIICMSACCCGSCRKSEKNNNNKRTSRIQFSSRNTRNVNVNNSESKSNNNSESKSNNSSNRNSKNSNDNNNINNNQLNIKSNNNNHFNNPFNNNFDTHLHIKDNDNNSEIPSQNVFNIVIHRFRKQFEDTDRKTINEKNSEQKSENKDDNDNSIQFGVAHFN